MLVRSQSFTLTSRLWAGMACIARNFDVGVRGGAVPFSPPPSLSGALDLWWGLVGVGESAVPPASKLRSLPSRSGFSRNRWAHPAHAYKILLAVHLKIPKNSIVRPTPLGTHASTPTLHFFLAASCRLWIPWQFVVRTSGLERFLSNHPHAPSLCVLFQIGRCNSRDKCNQIHVEVSFAALISQALHVNAVSNCCRMHGDLGSASRKNDIFSTLKTDVIEIRMPGCFCCCLNKCVRINSVATCLAKVYQCMLIGLGECEARKIHRGEKSKSYNPAVKID